MDESTSDQDHPGTADQESAGSRSEASAASEDSAASEASAASAARDAANEPTNGDDGDIPGSPTVRTAAKKRRRGSRGGKGRKRPAGEEGADDDFDDDDDLDEAANDLAASGDVNSDTLGDGSAQVVPVAKRPARRVAASAADPLISPEAELSAESGAASEPAASRPRRPAPANKPVSASKSAPANKPSPVDKSAPASEVVVAASRPVPTPNVKVSSSDADVELPERASEGRVADPIVAERALVPSRPKIGDTRPAPAAAVVVAETEPEPPARTKPSRNAARRAKQQSNRLQSPAGAAPSPARSAAVSKDPDEESAAVGKRRRNGRGGKKPSGSMNVGANDLDPEVIERRRGKERKGRPVGRYLMCVQVRDGLTQVAVLEGRSLVEHYVSRPADDVSQIHGNIYLGRVQNVLPGMEAAFVDISTPKNGVLYRGDVQYDSEDIDERASDKLRIEQMLKARQLIVCQITKNPIGAKGARLTQEVSIPGRFVVLIPHSKTYGISKRLPDDERKRLRNILDRVKPAEHGMIVRTAAENATEQELRADVLRLAATWQDIERKAEAAKKANQPRLLYREPELAVRVIREEFNSEYRGVFIDDQRLHDDVKGYIEIMNPELGDRVEVYDSAAEGLSIFEKFHVHEQLHKALDRKVWLPSGGSLIIEHTEALTVIDVNTGKNVGTSNLEQTVFHNNLEAADEIARQLRLRDVGGIIVIDFIDMEIRENRKKVVDAFRQALSRDKTRSQVFDISDLGLVEMTRKRIGEGLLTSFAQHCPNCDGRGVVVDLALLD